MIINIGPGRSPWSLIAVAEVSTPCVAKEWESCSNSLRLVSKWVRLIVKNEWENEWDFLSKWVRLFVKMSEKWVRLFVKWVKKSVILLYQWCCCFLPSMSFIVPWCSFLLLVKTSGGSSNLWQGSGLSNLIVTVSHAHAAAASLQLSTSPSKHHSVLH